MTLRRNDLIFPLHYISIDNLDASRPEECHDPEVLSFLRSRQWIDFRALRLKNPESEEVAYKIETMADAICSALRRVEQNIGEEQTNRDSADQTQDSAEAGQSRQKLEADKREQEERRLQEIETKRRAEQEGREKVAESRRQAEAERLRKESERGEQKRREKEERERREQQERDLKARQKADEERKRREGSRKQEPFVGAPLSKTVLPWNLIATPRQARLLTLIGAGSLIVIAALFFWWSTYLSNNPSVILHDTEFRKLGGKNVVLPLFFFIAFSAGLSALGTYFKLRLASIIGFGVAVLILGIAAYLLLPVKAGLDVWIFLIVIGIPFLFCCGTLCGVIGTFAMSKFRD